MSSPSNITPGKAGETRIHAFVALGSNLASSHGSPAATVLAAMEQISGWSEQPLMRSSLWSSAPVDCPPGSPSFINAVVALVPVDSESARSLLNKMLELERIFGRQATTVTNAPRCLDLDLICFGDQQVAEVDLILPHPRAHCREFVLAPLAEIAPNLRLPGQSRSVAELARLLNVGNPGVERMDP